MKMRADPVLLAVALGFLNPSVFEVDDDRAGESNPPPKLERVMGPDEVASLVAPALDGADLLDADDLLEDEPAGEFSLRSE